MLTVLQPCGPSSPSFSSSVWIPETLLAAGSGRPRGALPGSGRSLRCVSSPVPAGSPAPLGCLGLSAQSARPFYSPGLMRAFNFSFTTSVTSTSNNTPCARQKFAPGNHGFDHKTTAGRRSWLTLSAPRAVWSPALLEMRWSLPSPAAADGAVLVPSPPRVARLSEASGRRRFQPRWGPGLWTPRGCRGEFGEGPRSRPSPFDGPTMCRTYYVLVTSARNSHFLEGQAETAQGRLAHSLPPAPLPAELEGSGRAPRHPG